MLNFHTGPKMNDCDLPMKKMRTTRDPMSHRIIEKRRRDRMNNCLADLSQLIPATYLMKQGQGRIEKTEIIEMATKHIKELQVMNMEMAKGSSCSSGHEPKCREQLHTGFTECMDEVMRFLVEVKGYNPHETFCTELIEHLKTSRRNLCPDESSNQDGSRKTTPEGATCLQPDGTGATNSNSSPPAERPKLPMSGESGDEYTSLAMSKDHHLRSILTGQMSGQLLHPRQESWDEDSCTSSMAANTRMDSVSMCSMDTGSMRSQSREYSDHDSAFSSRRESESSKHSLYKFKNDIKLRFSSSGNDFSDSCYSSDYTDLASEDEKRKTKSVSEPEGSSSSSPMYPAPKSSSPTSSESTTSSQPIVKSGAGDSDSSADPMDPKVPGFALHPTGTYYIPVVISVSHILPYIQSDAASSLTGVCHPISIPVGFSSAVTSKQSPPPSSVPSPSSHSHHSSHSSSSSRYLPFPHRSDIVRRHHLSQRI